MDQDFNEQGEQAKFIYRREVGDVCSYVISMFKDYKGRAGRYEDIGLYAVVDAAESEELSKKKVSNLVNLLDGDKAIDDLSNLTNSRLLYTIAPRKNEVDPTIVNFRTYDGDGVSIENAILQLEKGVLNERS